MFDPNLDLKLSKLKVQEGDIILVTSYDETIPNSKYMKLLEYIQKNTKAGGVILAPKDIRIETVQEDSLQEIIDRLIEMRDNKWKSKLKKGD